MASEALSLEIERLNDRVSEVLAILKPDRNQRALYISLTEVEAGMEREIKGLELRHKLFPPVVHHQPAWELLLIAYRHRSQRKPISVSGLCHSIHAPGTTALRHLEALEAEGFLEREKDPDDGRRYWIVLSDKARRLMVRYFTELLS